MSFKLVVLFLFLILITRFIKPDWGNGFFFHPDENNMATSVFQMSSNNLNPNFYVYGQFPLYLTFFTTSNHSFHQIILTLRFWSAVFSSISVLFFYLIAKELFKKKSTVIISTLLIIFNPGLIQLAHFGTTESLLVLVFTINLFLSFKILKNYKFRYIFFASIISGIGLATKITAIFFTLPIFLSLFFVFLKSKNKFKFFLSTIYYLPSTILFFVLFSPYNFINFSSFLSTIKYETAIATGQINVFYTHQFLNTIPYIFQFTHIFPYISGLPVFILSILGFFIFILNTKYHILNTKSKLLIIFVPIIIYFLYTGQLFVKWTRFMSPLFFVFPFLTAYFISKIKNKLFVNLLVFISIIPGIFFLNLYIHPDIRVIASEWMNKNIPQNANVLSESGNVVNLPLNNSELNISNFDFYNSENIKNLSTEINKSDYIIIPSRRVFKNNFPDTKDYYQKLFSGELGFQEIKKFATETNLFLNPENAEETWTVFDNPTIRIYKK